MAYTTDLQLATSCCVLLRVPADVLQEAGSLTQLKTVFPKVFNKTHIWNAGDRLQDVFAYEFRKIKDAVKNPGTIQRLYIEKVRWHIAWLATLRMFSCMLIIGSKQHSSDV